MTDPTISDIMQAYAQDAVVFAPDQFHTQLDFTENSIEQVERILANLHSFPPAKVYKRLTNGAEDNVWIYYQVLRRDFAHKSEIR